MTHPVRRVWLLLVGAAKTFVRIDGAQRAGAIAHYAFFSLFPLIILSVAIAAAFIDREQAAAQIIALIQSFVPVGDDKQSFIFDTITVAVKTRGPAGAVAFALLAWASMRFFATLIRATNRAWGIEAHAWWRLPLKSFVFLAAVVTAIPAGIVITMLVKIARAWLFPKSDFSFWVYAFGSFAVPLLAVFIGLILFYKLAPRRTTRFSEVWLAALFATLLLLAAEGFFGLYLKHFATLNLVYGAFGGIMALLLWIYVSGCIFIFGACLCAVRVESSESKDAPTRRDTR